VILEFLITALAGLTTHFSGSTLTTVVGIKETMENLVLNVESEDNVKTVSLEGYSFQQYKKASITGTVIVDDKGIITEFKDVTIVGIPAKVSTVTGILSEVKADILLKGKALGLFNFEVHYQAKRIDGTISFKPEMVGISPVSVEGNS